MTICARCGEENPERARFCLACAAPLTAQADHQEERKVVSVLFVDLVGFTAAGDAADPEDVRATLRPYHARVRDEIERFGGVVEKYVGDAVMAVFGAPVAHEDDAERAVRAGLRVLDATEQLGLQARSAVNTGEALVALGARPELGEALVAGDVVNTASRLQGAAPTGALVVGELTYRTTRDQIDYEQLEPVAVKGKAEPVRIWLARGARSRFGVDVEIGGSTPFVGRDSELSLLVESYMRVTREEVVQLVTVIGEPGVGKTRLLRELGRWLDDQTDLVYWRQGRCLPYGEGIAFWALGEIVKAHAGILESDDHEAAAAKLAASVEALVPEESEREWIRGRLAPLVGVGGETGATREESFTAWRTYLEAIAAQRPLVLLVEDLHWADAALLEFLEHVIDWSLGVPLLVLCTARPELYERQASWGGGKRNSTTVSLSALSRTDTAHLLHALLEEAVLPAETQELLLERCGGNPLYAEQFARMLSDRAAGEISVPETVQAVIAARLDALGAGRKSLLQDAAVIGKVFWAEGVAALTGGGDREVLAALVDLAHRDLVRPARTSSLAGRREFAFTHLLVRDVAYGQIPRAERARKHRLAAEWLEACVGDRLADHAELLAHHYVEALELARGAGSPEGELESLRAAAVRLLVVAMKRARELDVRRALEISDRALALASEQERPKVLVEAAEIYCDNGRLPEARSQLGEAIPALRETGETRYLGKALVGLSWVLGVSGEAVKSEAAIDEAIAVLERDEPSGELAFALARRAGTLMMLERSEECLEHCERAVSVIEEYGEPWALGMLHQYRGISRIATGDLGGLTEVREALDDAVRRGGGDAMTAHVNLGYWTWWAEGPERGADLFRQGVEFARLRGTSFDWAEAELTWVLFELGEWDDLLTLSERLLQGAMAQGSTVLETMIRPTRGRVLLARGRAAEARADAEASLAVVRETDTPQSLVPSLTLAAGVAIAGSDRTGALALLEELEERTRGRSRSRAIEVAEAARIAAATGDLRSVERMLSDPYPPLPRARAQHASATAMVAEAVGDLELALELHRAAAVGWSAFGHRFEHAHALLGAGRSLLALGEASASELADARALFVSLGATRHVLEVDDLIGGNTIAVGS